MFDITAILHEVGPSRSNFRILDLAVLELEAEVCVNSEEERVQPPTRECQSASTLGTVLSNTLYCPGPVPSRLAGFYWDGGMPGTPLRMPHLGQRRERRGYGRRHRVWLVSNDATGECILRCRDNGTEGGVWVKRHSASDVIAAYNCLLPTAIIGFLHDRQVKVVEVEFSL